MSKTPSIFALRDALQVLAVRTNVLPAVGGATEDELHPDSDEIEDQRTSAEDGVLDEPWERGSIRLYVPLDLIHRKDEHFFRYFQDGSMRSFFVGTALEHDRQTPVIVGQVGCVSLLREPDGRLVIARRNQKNLLLVAFTQVSAEVRDQLAERLGALGHDFELLDIESAGHERQDLRRRAEDSMRAKMHEIESRTLIESLELATTGGPEDGWVILDGSIRFARFFEEMHARFGSGSSATQPPVISVAKNFSKTPRFRVRARGGSREMNLWQLLADLPEGNRTIAFKAKTQDRVVAVWYIRLRMKTYMEYPLMGVVKVELPMLGDDPPESDLVNKISGALLAERTVTPHGIDRRWHAHLYPISWAERCVKYHFVGISTLRAGLRWQPDPQPGSVATV